MKKILAVLLVAVLAIGCFALTACGGDATFGGNYEEATATEVKAFADSAALAGGTNEVDYTQGYQLVAKMDMGQYGKYDMDIKFANDDDKGLVLQARMNMNVSGQSMNVNAYVVNNYLYAEMYGQKVRMYDDIITPTYTDLLEKLQSYNLSAIAENAMQNTAIKLGMVKDEDGTTKIKIDMPEETGADGTIILVFNAQYNLVAMKFDIEMSTMKVNMELKPWGNKINLPNLDSYIG